MNKEEQARKIAKSHECINDEGGPNYHTDSLIVASILEFEHLQTTSLREQLKAAMGERDELAALLSSTIEANTQGQNEALVKNQSLEARIKSLENDLLDALDIKLKKMSAPTALSMLKNELDAYRQTVDDYMTSNTSLQSQLLTCESRVKEMGDKTKEFIDAHEQWEADVINEDKFWWPNKAQDVLRGKIYDDFLKVQELRNNLQTLLTNTKK